MTARALCLALPLLLLRAAALVAQDTLTLGALQAEALAHDPRAGQPGLLRAQADQRLAALRAEWRPQAGLHATASHQSDVTQLRLDLPAVAVPLLPKDRWQATLDVHQVLYDGGAVAARSVVERARAAEAVAGVDVALYRLRGEVNAAFFAALLAQARVRAFDALLADLQARRGVARARVLQGAALARDSAAVRVEELRARQARDEAGAARASALATLGRLTGRAIAEDAILAPPRLAAAVEAARRDPVEALRARPEYAQFDRARERLDREAEQARAENRPRVVAFGQGGVGRPGLNQFRVDPDQFWLAGVRVEWRPWTWGSAARTAEVLRLQDRLVSAEERALAAQLARAVEGDVADLTRLAAALAMDDQLVALREGIAAQARAQFDEGAITAAEYVSARTEVTEAALARERHRVELSQAQARVLTTLGLAPAALLPTEP